MKNNLTYYRHEVGSHNHWKFKVLRKKYEWGGEGKFWALNNEIANSENCILDLNDEGRKMSLAIDLDFDLTEFDTFLQYLMETCKLICIKDGKVTTETTQENLIEVSKERERKKDWIRGKREEKTSTRQPVDATEGQQDAYKGDVDADKTNVDVYNQQSKEKESKVKESSIEANASAPAKDLKKMYLEIGSDETRLNEFIQTEIPDFIEPYAKCWNFFALETGLSKVANLTDFRKKKIKTRSREPSFDLPEILKRARISNFIRDSKWFTFDWILDSETNYTKVLEGQYDNDKKQTQNGSHHTTPGSSGEKLGTSEGRLKAASNW